MRTWAAIVLFLLVAGSARADAPDENHGCLEAFVGSWKIRVKSWPGPDTPAQEGDGTAEIRWVLGGRFIEQRQSSRLMGKPTSGIGYVGFDVARRRYVSIWLDDLGTSILQTTGAPDPAHKTIKTRGAIDDAATGEPLKFEEAMTPVSSDEFTYEAWTSPPGVQQPRRVMEIVYTRRKERIAPATSSEARPSP